MVQMLNILSYIFDFFLINPDLERTEQTIELIKCFKDKYEIIFSICDHKITISLAMKLKKL